MNIIQDRLVIFIRQKFEKGLKLLYKINLKILLGFKLKLFTATYSHS